MIIPAFGFKTAFDVSSGWFRIAGDQTSI